MALGIPDLSGVRNSANHQEDRLRFRNQKGPMTTTAIDLPAIKSSPGTMVADSLMGSNIAFTMANGNVGQVPVTSSTLRLVQELVQGLLNDLPWRGPPVHLPRE